MPPRNAETVWASWGSAIKVLLARRDHHAMRHNLDGLSHEWRASLLARCDKYLKDNRRRYGR